MLTGRGIRGHEETTVRRAREGLEAQASTIPDAVLRRRFLEDIPYHREIASSWAALQERSATAL
jgi:hypothetical protein